jgi:hypothetical protein
VKVQPILLFILYLPLKRRVGGREKSVGLQEGDIHSYI